MGGQPSVSNGWEFAGFFQSNLGVHQVIHFSSAVDGVPICEITCCSLWLEWKRADCLAPCGLFLPSFRGKMPTQTRVISFYFCREKNGSFSWGHWALSLEKLKGNVFHLVIIAPSIKMTDVGDGDGIEITNMLHNSLIIHLVVKSSNKYTQWRVYGFCRPIVYKHKKYYGLKSPLSLQYYIIQIQWTITKHLLVSQTTEKARNCHHFSTSLDQSC